MSIYVTSDLHLNHARAPEFPRPFADVEEMNEALIDNWNAVVTSTDMVYIVGDLFLGKVVESLPMVARLKGTKALIPGNHDRMWKEKPDSKAYLRWASDYFCDGSVVTYDNQLDAVIGGHLVTMCHFPRRGYTDERYDGRYLDKYPEDDGGWLLHGHTHNPNRISGERQIHVGVEAWDYRPVHEDEIAAIIDTMAEIKGAS